MSEVVGHGVHCLLSQRNCFLFIPPSRHINLRWKRPEYMRFDEFVENVGGGRGKGGGGIRKGVDMPLLRW